MNYNLDNDHLRADGFDDIEFGAILNDMNDVDLWNDFNEETAIYDASTPGFIPQHDLANILESSLDI